MFRQKSTFWLAASLAASACAAVPPTGPDVVALPPSGKALSQFQQEDAGCRVYAQQQIGYGAPAQPVANQDAASNAAPSATAASTSGASTAELQQSYDAAYAQCMVASGNGVQSWPAWAYQGYGYPYPSAYPYAAYDDPWLGPSVGFGFFGRVGPRFNRPGFFRRGFHNGFHRGASNPGFHGRSR